jgi:hypothetical protein
VIQQPEPRIEVFDDYITMLNMTTFIKLFSFILLTTLGFTQPTHAQAKAPTNYLIFEGGSLWQSKNDQRVPGKGGTQFSLSGFNDGPFGSYRIYLGRKFSERHEMRLLYAPLELNISGKFSAPVTFDGSTFAADTKTNALYKFNSYRASYIYNFERSLGWDFSIGFTGKVRDAEVRLRQGTLRESKANVGFVPLLHFQARRELSENWGFIFDLDGLAARQGRAIDAALLFERQLSRSKQSQAYLGYRTIEGGADNDRVYNFAWLHVASLGLKFSF